MKNALAFKNSNLLTKNNLQRIKSLQISYKVSRIKVKIKIKMYIVIHKLIFGNIKILENRYRIILLG